MFTARALVSGRLTKLASVVTALMTVMLDTRDSGCSVALATYSSTWKVTVGLFDETGTNRLVRWYLPGPHKGSSSGQ